MYTLSLRCLGLEFHKHKVPPREWTDNYLGWIDSWTFYKPLAKVHAHFEHYFEIEEYAADYLRFRLSHHRGLNWMSPFFRNRRLDGLSEFLCRRLSGHVFVLRKI